MHHEHELAQDALQKLLSCDTSVFRDPEQLDFGHRNASDEREASVGCLTQDPCIQNWNWGELIGDTVSRLKSAVVTRSDQTAATRAEPAVSTVKECLWRGHARFCEDSGFSMIGEVDRHPSNATSPKGNRLTRELRSKTITLAKQDMMPARVQNQLVEDLKLAADEIRLHSAMENCVPYHRRRRMGSNNDVDAVVDFARCHQFKTSAAPSDTVAFGYDTDNFGSPKFGIGIDEGPFLISLTTIAMLASLSQV